MRPAAVYAVLTAGGVHLYAPIMLLKHLRSMPDVNLRRSRSHSVEALQTFLMVIEY